jgi:hypothetical protein
VSHFLKRVINQTVKAVANATRSSCHDAGYVMLIVQSKGGGDEAFLTFTADEIYAMACAEEGTPKTVVCPTLHALIVVLSVDTLAEHVFNSVKEDNPIGMAVKMTFTVGTLA